MLTWTGGAYTAGDFLDLIRRSPVGFAEGVAGATGPELEAALRRVARRELLLTEARARELEPAQARVDSARNSTRAAVVARAREIGLAAATPLPPAAGERVEAALIRVLSGEQQILPLGPVVVLLRDQGEWRIHQARADDVLRRIEELRSVGAGGGTP